MSRPLRPRSAAGWRADGPTGGREGAGSPRGEELDEDAAAAAEDQGVEVGLVERDDRGRLQPLRLHGRSRPVTAGHGGRSAAAVGRARGMHRDVVGAAPLGLTDSATMRSYCWASCCVTWVCAASVSAFFSKARWIQAACTTTQVRSVVGERPGGAFRYRF